MLSNRSSSAARWAPRDSAVVFSTPQWLPSTVLGTPTRSGSEPGAAASCRVITIMGREHEVVEFRTPQHPLVGSNHWGGASPLLSHHIPRESLMTTTYRRCEGAHADGGAPAPGGYSLAADALFSPGTVAAVVEGKKATGGGCLRRRRWSLWRLRWRRRPREEVVLGEISEGKSERSGGGFISRWPQGW